MAAKVMSKIPFINTNLLEVDSEIEDLYCPLEDPLLAREHVETRPIVPEDDELCEANEIPPLEDLAMSAFGQAFEDYWFRIALTPPQVMVRLGHYIPTNVDILKAALVIDNTCVYWKRRTEDRWPYECHDVFTINNDWKVYYLQKYYGEYIEGLDPNSIDYMEEGKAAIIMSHYIKDLVIDGLKIELSEETKFCLTEKLRLRLDSEIQNAINKQNRKRQKQKLKHKRKKRTLRKILKRKRRVEMLKQKIKIIKDRLRRGLSISDKKEKKSKIKKEKDKSKKKEKHNRKTEEKNDIKEKKKKRKSKDKEMDKVEESETDKEKEMDKEEKSETDEVKNESETDKEKESETDEEKTETDKEKNESETDEVKNESETDKEKEKDKVKVKKKKSKKKESKEDDIKPTKAKEAARYSRTKARRQKRKLFYEDLEKKRKFKKQVQTKQKMKKDIINKLKQRELYYNCLKRELRVREIIDCKYCRLPFKYASLKDVIKTTKITKPWNVDLPCNCKCRCVREIDSRLHLATFIGILYRLRSLTISYGFLNFDISNKNVFADINYQEFYCFIMSLTGLKRFRHLKIHLTNLDPLHSKILFFGINNMNHLEILELTHCTINDNCIKYLANYISGSLYSCRLKVLNLSGNLITGKGAKLIADALITEPIPFIKYLNLSENNIGSIGAQAISRVIVLNKTLKTIKLCKTLMDTTGITDIILAVFNNSFLVHLDTSCNNFSEVVEKDILEALNCNTTLESWDLRQCGLSDTLLKLVKENLFIKKFNKFKEEVRKLYNDEAINVYNKTSDRKELRLPCHLVKNRKIQEILTNMYLPPAGSSISTNVDYDLTTNDEDITTTTKTTVSKSSTPHEQPSTGYSEIKIFEEPSTKSIKIDSQIKPESDESSDEISSDELLDEEEEEEERHFPKVDFKKYCPHHTDFYEKLSLGSLRSGFTTYVDYDITMTEDTESPASLHSIPEQIEEESIIDSEGESSASF